MTRQLGNVQEADWRPAFEALEYFDPRRAINLEPLMLNVVDTPTRPRMVAVMSDRPANSLGRP